ENENIEIVSAKNKSTKVTTTESAETIPANKKYKVGNLHSGYLRKSTY
ncbi:38302_t:CDS:1, partial [Gigaspora margarita]